MNRVLRLDEGPDCRAIQPKDEVAFPVSGDSAVVGRICWLFATGKDGISALSLKSGSGEGRGWATGPGYSTSRPTLRLTHQHTLHTLRIRTATDARRSVLAYIAADA